MSITERLAVAGKPDSWKPGVVDGHVPGDNCWVEVRQGPADNTVRVDARVSLNENCWTGLMAQFRRQGHSPRDPKTAVCAAVAGIKEQLQEKFGAPESAGGHAFYGGQSSLTFVRPKTDDLNVLASEFIEQMQQGIKRGAQLINLLSAHLGRIISELRLS